MRTDALSKAARPAAGPPSLRARQRLARRERVLDAAEALVRESGGTDFSMIVLAERAEMSQTTPYALFGTKAAILHAVLVRALARTLGPDRPSPRAGAVELVLDVVDMMTGIYAAESAFYRPLWRALLGADEPEWRSVVLQHSVKWWRITLEPADEQGLLNGLIDADHLARELMVHALGTTDLWVQNEIEDQVMRAQYTFGTGLLLLAVAPEPERERILKRMQRAKKLLPVRFGGVSSESAAEELAVPGQG